MKHVVTLLVLLAPALGWWRPVGLYGHCVHSVSNPCRDQCYAATDSGVYLTENRGYQWHKVYDYGLHDGLRAKVSAPVEVDPTVFLAWGWGSRSDGLWFSDDLGGTWRVVNYMLYPCAFDMSPVDRNLMFMGSDTLDAPPLRSTDAGSTWVRCDSGLPTTRLHCFSAHPENRSLVLCGTVGHGLYLSDDSGATWRHVGPDSAMDVRGACWLWDESNVYAIGDGPGTSGIWHSTDCGQMWERELELAHGTGIRWHHASFLGDSGIYEAWEQGWRPRPGHLTNFMVHCLSSSYGGAFWYAGTEDGVYHLDETPGVAERPGADRETARPGTTPTVVSARALLQHCPDASILDASGRAVDARTTLRPGVYFMGQGPKGQGSGFSSKVIVSD